MRTLIALVFVVMACGGPKPKQESALVNEGSAVPVECCCKHTPIGAVDGKPLYEVHNRMECSGKQGTCVDEVQCQTTEPVE
jgi:hypothetical protein